MLGVALSALNVAAQLRPIGVKKYTGHITDAAALVSADKLLLLLNNTSRRLMNCIHHSSRNDSPEIEALNSGDISILRQWQNQMSKKPSSTCEEELLHMGGVLH